MINFQDLEKVAEFKNGELNWLEGRDVNAVYVILVGDEYYIGSSHYTYLRIGQHLDKLLKGEHHSCKLQEKFNAVEEFEVYSLDRGIERNKLQIVEAKYIQQYKPTLNIALTNQKRNSKHRIRELIREKGYTQQEFADKLGMARESLARILNSPSYPSLLKIAEALGVEEWELFTISTNKLDENTITCPTCGTKIEFKKKEE